MRVTEGNTSTARICLLFHQNAFFPNVYQVSRIIIPERAFPFSRIDVLPPPLREWRREMFSRSSIVDESRSANAYRMNGPPLDIRKRRNSRRSSRLIPVPFSPLAPPPPVPPCSESPWSSPWISWDVDGEPEIRGLLKLNPCTSSCSPRAGRLVRPEATHQERLIAEKITLLNTLPGQCFFSPVATCSPASPCAPTNELPLDTDNAEHLTRGSERRNLQPERLLLAKNLRVYVTLWRKDPIYFSQEKLERRALENLYLFGSTSNPAYLWEIKITYCEARYFSASSLFFLKMNGTRTPTRSRMKCLPVSSMSLRSCLQRRITARLLLYGTPR